MNLLQLDDALALETALGDPENPENTLSFKNAIALDEADAFPEEAISLLQGIGLPRLYVPQSLGGDFCGAEGFIAVGRTLARRNMSVSVGYSTMLWSTLAWIGGNYGQMRTVADWVANKGRFPCLAYSEAEHGADLSANELRAVRGLDGDYHLNGEKWPINRATRSEFLVLLARTDDDAHMRSHSLFLVDKTELQSANYYHLAKVKTHGLRGCDISGIGFRDCKIPASMRVGEEGHGLELALKGFQVTRTFCVSLSLGVGDTALRLVGDFADRRRLYNGRVLDLPHARDIIANSYLSQLIAEAVSFVAARGMHLHPEQFSSWSSIAKVQVAHLVDDACRQLATVLGARFYMRERHGEGMFQKMLRDGAVVSLFDGSTPVCLDSLATLLPSMIRARQMHAMSEDVDHSAMYRLDSALPPLDFHRFKLYGGGRDAVIESLPALLQQLQRCSTGNAQEEAVLTRLRVSAPKLTTMLSELDRDILDDPVRRGERNSAKKFAFAERYCALHSTIACLGLWLCNRDSMPGFFAQGRWLEAALVRCESEHSSAGMRIGALDPALIDDLIAQFQRQLSDHHMFSLLHWPLAARGSEQSIDTLFREETFNEHQYA